MNPGLAAKKLKMHEKRRPVCLMILRAPRRLAGDGTTDKMDEH